MFGHKLPTLADLSTLGVDGFITCHRNFMLTNLRIMLLVRIEDWVFLLSNVLKAFILGEMIDRLKQYKLNYTLYLDGLFDPKTCRICSSNVQSYNENSGLVYYYYFRGFTRVDYVPSLGNIYPKMSHLNLVFSTHRFIFRINCLAKSTIYPIIKKYIFVMKIVT